MACGNCEALGVRDGNLGSWFGRIGNPRRIRLGQQGYDQGSGVGPVSCLENSQSAQIGVLSGLW